MDNKTMLLILMIVLIAFIVLLAVLGIVFIIALRKRAPVVKVVMAPTQDNKPTEHQPSTESVNADATATDSASGDASSEETAESNAESDTDETDVDIDVDDDSDDDDDDEKPTYVTEGTERVTYKRSLTAKLSQLSRESKEWYSELKNELLSYEKVKDRMSWKHETYRIGRMTVARFIVRGKTLRMLLAVEPAGYGGTKYSVEDVSNIASMADTPTMYRIKNPRRVKFAKEMIAGMMKELKTFKDPHHVAQDFFIPYEGDMAFMQRGLVKRIVSGTVRTYKIEEVDKSVQSEAAATAEQPENASV